MKVEGIVRLVHIDHKEDSPVMRLVFEGAYDPEVFFNLGSSSQEDWGALSFERFGGAMLKDREVSLLKGAVLEDQSVRFKGEDTAVPEE